VQKHKGVFQIRKNKLLFGVLAAALAFALVLAGCGKKDSGGSGSGDSGGGAASAPKASGKAAPASDFTYVLSEDGKGVVIEEYTGEGGKLVIPAEIEGFPVVELGSSSFEGETSRGYGPGTDLTSVVIPAGVKKIGPNAFWGCKNLTSVTFLGSGVELEGGFRDCTELTELQFPDDEKALIPYKGQYATFTEAFVGCKKLPLAMRAKLKAMGFDEP
jgi:hypothetical protein